MYIMSSRLVVAWWRGPARLFAAGGERQEGVLWVWPWRAAREARGLVLVG